MKVSNTSVFVAVSIETRSSMSAVPMKAKITSRSDNNAASADIVAAGTDVCRINNIYFPQSESYALISGGRNL